MGRDEVAARRAIHLNLTFEVSYELGSGILSRLVNQAPAGDVVTAEHPLFVSLDFSIPCRKKATTTMNKILAALIAATVSMGAFAQASAPAAAAPAPAAAPMAKEMKKEAPAKKTAKKHKKAKAAAAKPAA